MKKILILFFLLIGYVSFGQTFELYETKTIKSGGKDLLKKQINKSNHTKLKSLKKAKIKLSDTLEVEATEFTLPDFVVMEGNKKVNVKIIEYAKI